MRSVNFLLLAIILIVNGFQTAAAQNDSLIFDRFVESTDDLDSGYASETIPLPIIRTSDVQIPTQQDLLTWHELNFNRLPTGIALPHEARPGNPDKPDLFLDTLDQLSDESSPKIDFVLSVVEGAGHKATIQEVIDLVNQFQNPHQNEIRIGAYAQYPGPIEISQRWPFLEDRTSDSTFYLTSGLSIANPHCYPYMTYSTHNGPAFNIPLGQGQFEDRRSPTKRSALFWAPIEKLTTARKHLPKDHLLIPYVNGFVIHPDLDSYAAPVPTRADLLASIKHMRLRGADGYRRTFKFLDSPDLLDNTDTGETTQPLHWWLEHNTWIKDYSDLVYSIDLENAWSSLDEYFGNEKETRIISSAHPNDRYSEKKSVVIYSGVRHVNDVMFLVANTASAGDFALRYDEKYNLDILTTPVPAAGPDNGIEDPPNADSLTSPCHATFRYKIVNLIQNGDFENGADDWNTNGKVDAGKTGNGLFLASDGSAIATSLTNMADAEPGAAMKISIAAKGTNALLDCQFRYRKLGGSYDEFQVDSWGPEETNSQPVSNADFQTFVARFHVPSDALPDSRIGLKILDRALSESLVVNDIVIKFGDSKNLLFTGDFDNSLAGWLDEGDGGLSLEADPEVGGSQLVEMQPEATLLAHRFNEFNVGGSGSYIVGFKAKGQGILTIEAKQFDQFGNQLPDVLSLGVFEVLDLQLANFFCDLTPSNLARRIQLVVKNTGGDTLYFDDIVVKLQ